MYIDYRNKGVITIKFSKGIIILAVSTFPAIILKADFSLHHFKECCEAYGEIEKTFVVNHEASRKKCLGEMCFVI